jgi:phage shock protein E
MYQQRAEMLGFSSPGEVKEALSNPDTLIIDVRSHEEIAATAAVDITIGGVDAATAVSKVLTPGCHDGPALEEMTLQMAPDKNTTIVIYCLSGRRAGIAKEKLQNIGYQRVLNAGGLNDVLAIQQLP